ncbi:hypothetical protein Gotur_018514 [Gossypium turneri]
MLHLAFGPTLGPILFRSSLRLSCDNMSLHKFKGYSMVKMDIDARVANATVYAMEVLPPKGQPFLKGERIPMDAVFKPWVPRALESADKYGDVAQLLFVKPDDALLKAMNVDFRGPLANLMGLPIDVVKARLKDKNGPYISWSDISDAMGKACGNRHLALFTFSVYGLIVFPKSLGYVSVLLADFLFQIEKWVNLAPAVLAETIISLNFIRKKCDKCFLRCTKLLFVWMKSHFRCLYKHFHQVFVPSTRLIEEFLESEWPPNQSIEGAISYSSLMILNRYKYDQCIPAGLNRVEVSI